MPQIPHITLQVVPKAPMRYMAHTFWSLGVGVPSPTNKRISIWEYPGKLADSLYYPVVNCQGVQDANCLHFWVPDASGIGARSQPMKYSASGSPNKSADTQYNPVSGPQGPQEFHGKQLFVPAARGVGHIKMTHGYKDRAWTGLSYGTTFIKIGSAVRPWLNQIGRSVCDLYI